MIKKEHRLTKNKHFQYVYRKGEIRQTQFLTLVFVKTKFRTFKVGFSVSKKIGKAVIRNKVKRRMRECFDLMKEDVNTKHNYVFVAKKGIENLMFQQIKDNMRNVLKKAHLINE